MHRWYAAAAAVVEAAVDAMETRRDVQAQRAALRSVSRRIDDQRKRHLDATHARIARYDRLLRHGLDPAPANPFRRGLRVQIARRHRGNYDTPADLHDLTSAGSGHPFVAQLIWIGLGMIIGAAVLAIAPVGDDARGLEIASIAAASVPVIGAALAATSSRELRDIAFVHLRRTLLAAQLLAFAAVLTFIASVLLATFGVVDGLGAVYAALAGGTLGGVSLLVGNRVKDARSLAFTISMVDGITDPDLQNELRFRLALEEGAKQSGERALPPRPE